MRLLGLASFQQRLSQGGGSLGLPVPTQAALLPGFSIITAVIYCAAATLTLTAAAAVVAAAIAEALLAISRLRR